MKTRWKQCFSPLWLMTTLAELLFFIDHFCGTSIATSLVFLYVNVRLKNELLNLSLT